MTNPNNGWFDDPQDLALERWWDGSAWSVHVRPKFTTPPTPAASPAPAPAPTVPAGWYGDPQVAGQLRYWDGATWTNHTTSNYTRDTSSTTAADRTYPPPTTSETVAPRPNTASWGPDSTLASSPPESYVSSLGGAVPTSSTAPFETAPSDTTPDAPSWSQHSHETNAAPVQQPWVPQPWVNTDAAQVEGEYATDVWSGDRQPWEQPHARSFPQQSRPVPGRTTSSWSEYPRNGPPSTAVGTFSSRLKSTQSKLIGAAVLVIALIVGLQEGISEYREKRSESSEKISESSEKISESIPTEDDLPFQAGDEDRVAVSARDGNMYDFDAVYYLATAAACTDLYGVVQEKATILKAPTVGSVGSKERIKQQSEYLAATAAVYEAYAAVLATIGGLDNGATINGIPLTLNYSKRAELQEKFERYAETNAMIAEGLATASTNKEFLAVLKKHGFSGGPAITDYMEEARESFATSFTDNSVGILFTSELVPACDSFYD